MASMETVCLSARSRGTSDYQNAMQCSSKCIEGMDAAYSTSSKIARACNSNDSTTEKQSYVLSSSSVASICFCFANYTEPGIQNSSTYAESDHFERMDLMVCECFRGTNAARLFVQGCDSSQNSACSRST